MKSDNYKITQYSVSSILNYVENSQIAIPEIQRPFVWKGEEVRALIDSLYEGYPIGYLIVWQNSQVRVRGFGKGGTKKILIDGQQRVTALMAALLGKEVLDEQYQSCRIRIAFNPLAQTGDERFAVCDEKHEQDSKWIPDISIFFRRDFSFRQFEKEYKEANPGEDFTPLEESVDTLKEIVLIISVIYLESHPFIRYYSKMKQTFLILSMDRLLHGARMGKRIFIFRLMQMC